MNFDQRVDVKLSKHARDRMAEMELNRGDIRKIILDAETVTPANATRTKEGHSRGRPWHYGSRHLYVRGDVGVVVDDTNRDRLVVVTVLVHTTDLYERAS